jgi:cytochrome c oxidase cbb3-type subunit 3
MSSSGSRLPNCWAARELRSIRNAVVAACLTLNACGQTPSSDAGAGTTPPTIRYESHVAAGGLLPAAGTLRNPHADDAAIARAGSTLFTNMNCDGCHAPDAGGLVGPNLADGRWRYGGTDAELFTSIYYGRPKGMPAYGGTLGAEGIWVIVTYLRSLPVPAEVATESWISN